MFYIRPPTGHVSLNVLENCVFTRLEYLNHLTDDSTTFEGNFEYLLENSQYDKIGHFMLRLSAAVSLDLWVYWITREVLLLKQRLHYASTRQLYRLLRSILQQLKTFRDKRSLINVSVINVCSFYLQPIIFKHIVSKEHTKGCSIYHCKVKYELIPDLVKMRKVNIVAGYAIIYCSQWIEVLSALFCTYITEETKRIKIHAQLIVTNDLRLNALHQNILSVISKKNVVHGRITSDNIDAEVKNFPLCMQHLHIILRDKHRLSHYARLYYSLFLKENGMKLEDSVKYWKEEYSKPTACGSACSHNWQVNEQKFIYSIRHLYGLEGSRRNYMPPNCKAMYTTIPSAKFEGGCPFKNFDTDVLFNLLSKILSKDDTKHFLKHICTKNPEVACAELFKKLQIDSNINIITSPSQYYQMMIMK